MTTITKERIELFIKNPLENGLTRGEQMELARIALTSLESEPVAWTDDGRDQFESLIRFHADDKNHEALLLRANEGMNYQDPNVDLAWIFWKSSREHLFHGKGD